MRLRNAFKSKVTLICATLFLASGTVCAKPGLGQVRVLTQSQIAFSDAVEHDRLSVLEKLVADGVSPNQMVREGDPALVRAAFSGNEDLTKALVQKGASINKTIGWSALHYAATNGHDAVVKYLLAEGADVNARTDAGVTPLYMAARGMYRTTVMTLLRAGAYRDLCNVHGQSPADAARKAGDAELADYLAVERCIEPPTSPFRQKIESAVKN